MIHSDCQLDARGLHCPLPLLRLKKQLNDMESGEIVQVIATDPASVLDFGVFSDQTGNVILEQREQEGVYYFWIKKN